MAFLQCKAENTELEQKPDLSLFQPVGSKLIESINGQAQGSTTKDLTEPSTLSEFRYKWDNAQQCLVEWWNIGYERSHSILDLINTQKDWKQESRYTSTNSYQ